MTDKPADCRTVRTQEELAAALAAKQEDASVCVHVHSDAEESVRAWELANRGERPIAGEW